MKRLASILFVVTLLLLATNSPAQSPFYPLHTGDTWVYWEYLQYGLGVWDTITVRIVGDTTIAGAVYRHSVRTNWHYHERWDSYGRVDTSGDVYKVDPSTGQESLIYRLSDTSGTWWRANGYLQRFDSCVTKEMFGRPRRVLYVNGYTTTDTTLRNQDILVEGIGYYTSRPINIVYDGGTTILHHGWINSVLFGADPFAPPPFNFPLHVGDQWYYAGLPYPTGTDLFVIYVPGDTVMPNGKAYAQVVTDRQGGRDFLRQSGDSVWRFDITLRNEYLYFDFSRGAGDTVSSFFQGHDTTDIVVRDVRKDTIFSTLRRVWKVFVNPLRHGVDDEYGLTIVDSIGIISRSPSFGDAYSLQGARINGRVYGSIFHPGQVTLVFPEDRQIFFGTFDGLRWRIPTGNPTVYELQVAKDSLFLVQVADSTLSDTTARVGFPIVPQQYWWRVRAGYTIEWGPWSGKRSFSISPCAVDEAHSSPAEFALHQNYPNPFNPTTTIRISLPHGAHVLLTVYNTLGQQVATLVNGEIDAGYHEVQFNAGNLASGVYIYRLQAGSYVDVKKMAVMK